MGRNERGYFDLLIYSVGFWLALTMALNPNKARSGTWEAGGPAPNAPRWSNDAHIADSVSIIPPSCADASPGQRAEYVPGIDARGRPVAPADDHTGFVNSLPVEVDVDLDRRRIGHHRAYIDTGPMIYDAGRNTLNGYPLGRDCTPHFK